MDKVFSKIHNEGYKFLVIFGLVTIILYFISSFLGLIGLVLTVWCYYFFRDPERVSINDETSCRSFIFFSYNHLIKCISVKYASIV